MIAEAIKSNTSLQAIHMGAIDKIDPDIVESILTTLRLNKFVSGLLEDTGFRQHVHNITSYLY